MSSVNPLSFPIFRILLSYVTGIIIGIVFFPEFLMFLLGATLAVFFTALVLYLIFYQQIKTLKYWYLPALLVYPFFIIAGIFLTLLNDPRTRSDYFPKQHLKFLVITADEPGYIHGKYLRFKAVVNAGSTAINNTATSKSDYRVASGLIMISMTDTTNQVNNGDVFLIPNSAIMIEGPKNLSGFDYRYFERIHQVFYQCTLSVDEFIRLKPRHSLRSWAFGIQAICAQIIGKYIPDVSAAAFLTAMLAGLRTNLPAQLYTAFSRTGTVHIISISGMHVHIVYFLLGGLTFLIRKTKNRGLILFRKLFLTFLIWVYAMISGFSPAVCRCALAITLMIFTENMDRKVAGPLMLSLSAFLMLLYQPWLLADMGFQLSYMAVAGLYLFQSTIRQIIYFNHRLLREIWNLCATSIAAQLLTFPLCLYYFHQFPVYFLFANLLIIPLTGLILYIGIALLTFSYIPIIGRMIAALYHFLYLLMNYLLNTISTLPGAVIDDVYPDLIQIILIMSGVFLVLRYLEFKDITVLKSLIIVVIFLLAENFYFTLYHLRRREIVFVNSTEPVGICILDGTKAYIINPRIPDSTIYQRIFRPSLASRGIQKIVLINSNFKSDHLLVNSNMISFYSAEIMILKTRNLKNTLGFDSPGMNRNGLISTNKNRIRLVYITDLTTVDTAEINSYKPTLIIAGSNTRKATLPGLYTLPDKKTYPFYSVKNQGALAITL